MSSHIVCKVGNSHVAGYLFQNDAIVARFRIPNSDKGLCEKTLRWLDSVKSEDQQIMVGSVNLPVSQKIKEAIREGNFFAMEVAQANSHAITYSRLTVKYRGDAITDRTGPDLLANVYGFHHLYPHQDGIVIDFGTATTYAAIKAGKDIQALAFGPGIQTSLNALHNQTAALPALTAKAPENIYGANTEQRMLSGTFYGQIGAAKEFAARMTKLFDRAVTVVVTGGFVNKQDDGSGYKHKNTISDCLTKELEPCGYTICPDLTAIGFHELLKEQIND